MAVGVGHPDYGHPRARLRRRVQAGRRLDPRERAPLDSGAPQTLGDAAGARLTHSAPPPRPE